MINRTKRIFSSGWLLALIPLVAGSCSNSSAAGLWQTGGLGKWLESNKGYPKEVYENGYSVSGSMPSMPQHLLLLNELTPAGLKLIDSTRTDASGKFSIKGNLKNETLCYLQFADNSGVVLILNNSTSLKLDIEGSEESFTYTLSGKNYNACSHIKEVMDLNNSYALRLASIENQANSLPEDEAGSQKAASLEEQFNRLLAERTSALVALMDKYNGGLVPYFVTLFMFQEPEFTMLEKAYQYMSKATPESIYTKDLEARYNAMKATALGSVAPEIDLPGFDGKNIKLSSLKGSYVLLDFWASWCRPCRMENPNNVRMYRKFHDKGFEIYGVSLDNNAASWKAAAQMDSLSWVHVSDLKGWQSSAAAAYKVHSIPYTLLLDKEGRIIAKDLRGEALSRKLYEIFGE